MKKIDLHLLEESEEESRAAMDLKLLACPFCGGRVRPRWSPWIDGEPCWEIEHIDYEAAVAAKCPLEMGGYRDLEELSAAWNERK